MSQTPQIEVDGDAVVISVPMKLRRRSGRKEIHVPGGLPRSESRSDGPSALLLAVARAHYWQELIDSEKYRSTRELAEALGVDRSYVGRIMRLNSLAPKLVEAILRGEEPEGMTLGRLVAAVSTTWQEQSELLRSLK